MSWLFSLLASLACGATGLLTAGAVATSYADWYGMSTREGQVGFFVIGMALLGGLACLVLGLVAARLIGTSDWRGCCKAAALSCALIVAAGAATASGLYLLADFPPTIDGKELLLDVEIRLPEGRAIPPVGPDDYPRFVLSSVVDKQEGASRYGSLKVEEAREEGGRWIVPAEAALFTSRGQRVIDARIGETVLAAFLVPLAPHPGKSDEQWGEWLPRPPAGDPPWPETETSFRFRVRRLVPPTADELAQRKERQEQAEFEAIAPDAPLAAWLSYTPSWQNAARRAAAIERITGNPEHVRELGAMMLSTDPREAEAALRVVGELPEPDPGLVPAVQAAGRDAIERIKRFNASTVEQDPTYEGAADVSIRFSSWMAAARALREKTGADFVPEVREILELSRVREDSQVMQQDVRRVASYYMKSWAGVEPLPGDPPPR